MTSEYTGKSFLIFFSLIFLQSSLLFAQAINVKKYGAKGDGVTDDYAVLKQVANKINQDGGGEIFFPKGNYYIAQYHMQDNNLEDIVFKNCNGITIKGTEAIITLNGNFRRLGDIKKKYSYSSYSAIMPFSFNNCSNIEIDNLEVNGNVNMMTRDEDVKESGGFLLHFISCRNVTLNDLFVHHAQTDGIYINGDCFNFKATNVMSSNNARQGMSIIRLDTAEFNTCSFKNTGFTGGDYGFHAPGAGVDIEPTATKSGVHNIRFINCTFESNYGSQLVVGKPTLTTNITISGCTFKAGISKSTHAIVLAAKDVVLENNDIDCGNSNIFPVWNSLPGSKVIIRNNKIKSSASGIMANTKDTTNDVLIENNTIEYTGTSTIRSYFPYIQSNISFKNNKIIIPEEYQKPQGVSSLIQNAKISQGNEFYSKGKKLKPRISYQGTSIIGD